MGDFAARKGNLMGNIDPETEDKIIEFINNFVKTDEYNEILFGFISAGTERSAFGELIRQIDNNKFKSVQDIRDFLIQLACEHNDMLEIAYKLLTKFKKSTTIQ